MNSQDVMMDKKKSSHYGIETWVRIQLFSRINGCDAGDGSNLRHKWQSAIN